MRLRICQSREGDALVLSQDHDDGTGAVWTHVMVDGGRAAAYRESMRGALAGLERSHDETNAASIDLLVVSHIDRDHIEGVLRYADDLVDWAVHDHQANDPTLDPRPPAFARPPRPQQAWHNSFDSLLDHGGSGGAGSIGTALERRRIVAPLASQVSDVIAQLASQFDPLPDDETTDEPGGEATAAATVFALEAGEKQAHHLTERLGEDQLSVPLNAPTGGALMRVEDLAAPVEVGSLRFRVLGPTQAELDELEREWRVWLTTAQDAIREVSERSDEIEDALGSGQLGAAMAQFDAAATQPILGEDFLRSLAIAAGASEQLAATLGRASRVTWPNKASLMLLAEAGQGDHARRILLTGDGHHARILSGLEAAGVLPRDGTAHVDVLKVPHHGSEHNADDAFFRRVIADHYVFCGDGSHHNPDLRIIDALIASRLGPAGQVSTHPDAGNPFTLWFSTAPNHPSLATRDTARGHIQHVETHVQQLRAQHEDAFAVHWSNGDFIDLDLPVVGTAPVGPGPPPGRAIIALVVPNPTGGDTGNEFCQLHNDGGTAVSLDGLHLEDRQGGVHPLSGTLLPGATRTVVFPRGSAIRLANSADDLRLMDGANELDSVTWANAGSGEEFGPHAN